jgi:Protein of unknown function DUF262
MSLQTEIDQRSREIHTDGYPMSVGEVISMYNSDELNIHPEFQRFFRWTDQQKSRLIESILLGIPIPSIFVAQTDEGIWDVIDGLQRLSTILEFIGDLKDENGGSVPASVLLATEYLPSLQGKYWDNPEDVENSFTNAQRLDVKRSKLDMKIVKKQSDQNAKYDLFQRLNTGGSRLSDQEVRNCLLIMLNRDFYYWLRQVQHTPSFQDVVALSDRQQDEQYDAELVLRFFACKNATEDQLRAMVDMDEFLTSQMRDFATGGEFDPAAEQRIFIDTFTILAESIGPGVFTRFDIARQRVLGGFSVAAFEAIAVGVGSNIAAWLEAEAGDFRRNLLLERIDRLRADRTFRERTGSGIGASTRVPVIVPLAKRLFRP